MTEFEDRLSMMLTERANQIDVIPDAAFGDGESAEGVHADVAFLTPVHREPLRAGQGPGRGGFGDRGRWLSAAAAVAVVLGLGAFLIRPGGTSGEGGEGAVTPASESAAAASAAEGSLEDWLPSRDAVVWMDVDVSAEERAAVAEWLADSPEVEVIEYLGPEATYAEFVFFWRDSPEIIDSVEPELLPTSYRIRGVKDLEPSFISAISALRGVQSVNLGEFAQDVQPVNSGLPDSTDAIVWVDRNASAAEHAEVVAWLFESGATRVLPTTDAWGPDHLIGASNGDLAVAEALNNTLLPRPLLVETSAGAMVRLQDLQERPSSSPQAARDVVHVDILSGENRLEPTDIAYLAPRFDVLALGNGIEFNVEEGRDISDAGSGLVLGRPVEGGIEDLVSVRIVDWTEAASGGSYDPVEFDGVEFRANQNWPGQIARSLVGGGWLEISATETLLPSLVSATTVTGQGLTDARVDVDLDKLDDGFVVLRRLDDLEPFSSSTFFASNEGDVDFEEVDNATLPPGLVFVAVGAAATTEPDDVFLFNAGTDMESVEIRGHAGYFTDSFPPLSGGSMVAWWEPSGHAFVLWSSLERDEALAFANSLEEVDRDQWYERARLLTLLALDE